MISSRGYSFSTATQSLRLPLVRRPDSGSQPAGFMAHTDHPNITPHPLAEAQWDWRQVKKVLVVRLRSIGDTVLATPALNALRRFLPGVRIDILLEDWIAPLLDGFEGVDNVIAVERKGAGRRARVARRLRATNYDVVYNLHGGTTATFLTRATGARHRVGYSEYRYSRLHNHLAPSPVELWGREKLHSVEQQLGLIGWTGVPVSDLDPTRLYVTNVAEASVASRLLAAGIEDGKPVALLHPAAAFDTKQWATENFARIAEYLDERGFKTVAIVAPHEAQIANVIREFSSAPISTFTDFSLPEVTALASRARLFVGNDSGIAHIAAAVRCPSVVIFGSSNVTHWRPWSNAPSEIVREELPCQPCPGYTCGEFDQPECIRRVPVERVSAAIERVLRTDGRG
jgi:lipopolysaccharide heptosyltransferase II